MTVVLSRIPSARKGNPMPTRRRAVRKSATLTLKVDPRMVRRLDDAADAARRSRADWIRLVLERELDALKTPSSARTAPA